MKHTEALKLALEALESGVDTQIGRVAWTEYDSCLIADAILAIREALAQPEPTGQAPCARHCEANAFKIVIRGLKGDIIRLKIAQALPQQNPVAFCDPSDPDASTAFSWPGTARKREHTTPLHTNPPSAQPAVTDALTTADKESPEYTSQIIQSYPEKDNLQPKKE